MIVDKSNRRLFLQGVGGCTLAIPFLASLVDRAVRAAPSGTAPRRFFAIKSYSAQHIVDWYPTVAGNGYEVRTPQNSSGTKADGTTILDQTIGNTVYTRAPLTDFATSGVSTILDTDLNAYLDRMVLLRGLDFLPTTNHNDGGMLGNFAAADDAAAAALPHVPTIDQVLAYSSRFYPRTPVVRSLHLAPGGANSFSFTDDGISGGDVRQVQAHLDPLTAFNEVFNAPGVMPPSPDQAPRPDPNLRLVDRVYAEYASVRDGSRLGRSDREMLERHMNFLAELQTNLAGTPTTAACVWPEEPRSIRNQYSTEALDVGDAYSLMIDVAVAAVLCGYTRIVTLDVRKALSDGRGGVVAGYYHGDDSPSTWHGDAHSFGDPAADENIVRINHWIAHDIFARVLQRLDVLESETETYLDNTLVMWGNELGFNHLNWSVPTLLAGRAGGTIATGQYLDYIDWDSRVFFSQHGGNVIRGIPYNRLLVSVLQSMGLDPSDYERGGQPGYGSIETVGKSADLHAIDYDLGSVGDPLPGLMT